ncbi:hypothetical protein C2G38_2077751 [Gigaspora rosea]|uniref:Uncharacterized protein n=1 Tax=Gigaspora rosea TaxID=44941 RepID=A0A397VNZ8_9GLOM|nr:hypothetical protein C2G38_2077751 [Gigaspora rosea]
MKLASESSLRQKSCTFGIKVFGIPVGVVIGVVVEIVVGTVGIGVVGAIINFIRSFNFFIFSSYRLTFFSMPGFASFVWSFAFPGVYRSFLLRWV